MNTPLWTVVFLVEILREKCIYFSRISDVSRRGGGSAAARSDTAVGGRVVPLGVDIDVLVDDRTILLHSSVGPSVIAICSRGGDDEQRATNGEQRVGGHGRADCERNERAVRVSRGVRPVTVAACV